jgi:ribosomal protein S18 acetylase RimI-like enzyme
MHKSVNIRSVAITDAESISQLMNQLGYATLPSLIAEKITAFSNSLIDQVFIAETEGKVVGVISCHITSLFHQAGASGRITSLVIDKDFRNMKIAKSLVQQAENFFVSQGCIKFEVTSSDRRTEAHEFYKACGYEEDERRFIKYPEKCDLTL